MKIEKNIQTPNFKGCDARPLRGIVTRYTVKDKNFLALIEEIKSIGKKSGFDVFLQTPDKIIKKGFQQLPEYSNRYEPIRQYCWPQDYLSFLPNGKVVGLKFIEGANAQIAKLFKRPLKSDNPHIQGGNFFIVKHKNENVMLVGENDISRRKLANIRDQYGVKRVLTLSQPDFHIDLAIRPLNNSNILVTDDEMTINILRKAQNKMSDYLKKNYDPQIADVRGNLKDVADTFENYISNDKLYTSPKVVQQELENYGFNVIKVPGRIMRPLYENEENDDSYHYLANFMNAIVHQKKDNSLVYITNHSPLDEIIGISPVIEHKLNFGIEKAFKNRLKGYIAPKDIHFVSGNHYLTTCLEELQGGVHCLFAEIPRLDTTV